MSTDLDPFVLVPDQPAEGQEATFVYSPEVEAVANAHLAKHLTLARLRADPDLRLGYALQVGVKPDQGRSREATIDTIAKAVKAPKLWAALGDGTLDMIVSDHSPCPPEMKLRESGDFLAAWGGWARL